MFTTIMNHHLKDELINDYEKALKALNSKLFIFVCYFFTKKYVLKRVKKILFRYYLNDGICTLSIFKYGIPLVKCRWVRFHIQTKQGYWCTPVNKATSLKELKGLLQIRIDILKSFDE